MFKRIPQFFREHNPFSSIWHGFGLVLYGLWVFFVLSGAGVLAIFALVTTWNAGMAALLNMNTISYPQGMGVMAFLMSFYILVRAIVWAKRRFL